MGSGISFMTSCCNKNNQELLDVDITKMNYNMPNINYLKTPSKFSQKENYFENIIKTDIKKNKFNKNDFLTFKKRNYTQKHFKRNNNFIHINTLKTLKNSRFISLGKMSILRNNTSNKFYNSYFNTLSGKLGKNSSSFYFSSGVKDIFNELNSKNININTKLKLTGELFSNKKLIIDKCSLKSSMKKESNGIISFGISYTNDSIYDYILDKHTAEKIDKNKKNNNSKIFEIFLDMNEKIYVLYFIHNSFLLYYKINEKLNLDFDKDYYIIIGKIFMSIKIKNSKKLKINIEIKAENEKKKKYSFELKDLPIKIGKENCSINIPKLSTSKIHSCINYENGSFWYKDESLKNGSTLVIKEDDFLKLKGKMNFKLEDIPFTIEEINKQLSIKEENTNERNTIIDNKEDDEDGDDD